MHTLTHDVLQQGIQNRAKTLIKISNRAVTLTGRLNYLSLLSFERGSQKCLGFEEISLIKTNTTTG